MARHTTVDISIVIPIHEEANLLHPMFRSVVDAVMYAKEKAPQLTIEFVLVLDSSDSYTKAYIDRARDRVLKDMTVIVKEVDNHNPADTRNDGMKVAHGTYVLVIDADDLISRNLLYDAYRMMAVKDKPVVLHPEYIVSFDKYSEVFKVMGSDDKAFIKTVLAEYNQWPAPAFAKRETFLNTPYVPSLPAHPFGPEDWQWNIDTYGRGIEHLTIPKTAYFYRRKQTASTGELHNGMNLLLDEAPLLSDRQLKLEKPEQLRATSVDVANQESALPVVTHRARHIDRRLLPIIDKSRLLQRARLGVINVVRRAFGTEIALPVLQSDEKLPQWLQDEMSYQYKYEHRLFVTLDTVDAMGEYKPRAGLASRVYYSMLREIDDDIDYFFMIPSFGVGGGELFTKNCIDALGRIDASKKITVLVDDKTDSVDRMHIPAHVKIVGVSESFKQLSEDEQSWVVANLLIQTRVKRLHIVLSSVAYRMFRKYAKPLSQKMAIYAFFFAADATPEGQRVHTLLDEPNLIRYMTRIFTDNQAAVDDMIAWCGFEKEKFTVLYQPYRGAIVSRAQPDESVRKRLSVLWAGRLDAEKRPDKLIAIAEMCHTQNIAIDISVYGSPVLSDNRYKEQVEVSPAVQYKGGYTGGLSSLNLNDYDAFLLTSDHEGLPNVLLEAIAGGLIVVAPNVGGIPELVRPMTGYLVDEVTSPDAYVKQLKRVAQLTQTEINQKILKAKTYLERHHTVHHLIATLKKETNYTD